MLLSHAFSNFSLYELTNSVIANANFEGKLKVNYAYAFEFLLKWMPTVNKNFELSNSRTKKPFLEDFSADLVPMLPSSPLIITLNNPAYLAELAAKVRAIEDYRTAVRLSSAA